MCYIDVKRDIRDAEGRRGVDVDSDRVSSKTSAVRRELLERKKKKEVSPLTMETGKIGKKQRDKIKAAQRAKKRKQVVHLPCVR